VTADAGFPLQIGEPTEERYGPCSAPGCALTVRWWPAEAGAEGRWVHTEPWLVAGSNAHNAEVAA
jgi:hypothetical protein